MSDQEQTDDPTFKVNGKPLDFPASMIPQLFVAWIAATRANYYAALDHERGDGEFDAVFNHEVRHALRNRDEIEDWAANNTNWSTDPIEGIEISYSRK